MGMSLNAYAAYGFVLERHLEVEELPESITKAFTLEEVSKLTYSSPEYVEGGDYLKAVVENKYPLLDIDYPGNEYCEELIVFVKSNAVDAYYGAEPLVLEKMNSEELKQIEELAALFDQKPKWYLYPTHG
jgi:hypothetical protein